MNKEELKDSINYCLNNNPTHQAIMIVGDWGIGKTFFIEKILIPYLKSVQKKRILYYSLYGKKNCNQIKTELVYQKLLGEKDDDSKRSKILYKIKNLIPKGISFKSNIGIDMNIDVTSMIGNFIKLENSIIILDDFERCNSDTKDIMGVVDDLSKGDGNFLIVVGNKKELYYRENDIVRKIYIKNNNKNNKEDSECVLFRKKYLEDFEKVFKLEIHLDTDIETVYDEIFISSNNDLANFYKENKIKVIQECENLNFKNIRILISVKNSFDNIIMELQRLDNRFSIVRYSYKYADIFIYLLVRTIQFKLGIIDLNDCDSTVNNFQVVKNSAEKNYDIDNYMFSFGFIDYFIKTATFDRLSIERFIEEELSNNEKSRLSIYKYERWDILDTDRDILNFLEELLVEINNNMYSVDVFGRIINILVTIKYWAKIDFNIDEFINALKISAKKIEYNEDELNRFSWSQRMFIDVYREECSNIFLEVEKILKERDKVNKNIKLSLIPFFEKRSLFDSDFYKFCIENRELYYSERSFANYLPASDSAIDFINNSCTAEIDSFSHILNYIYLQINNSDEYLINDVEYLKQLLQGVKKIIVNEKQQIEKVKLNQLVETIKKCISKLSKDELSIG